MSSETAPAPPTKNRFLALDVFRGIAILGMLIVNNIALGSATPKTLLHAEWSGAVHFADLVFPWFLLAMGVAAGLSSRPAPVSRVVRRVAALLVLGMIVDSAVQGTLYIGLGVLQLIGLAYGVAAIAMRLPVQGRLLLATAMLIIHSALLLWLPQPGALAGTVTQQHNAIYALNPYLEPLKLRGLLSVLPTGALAIFASFVGVAVRRKPNTAMLFAIGATMTLAGLSIGLTIPMLKPIWTASYVLYAGGLGVLLLGILATLLRLKAFELLCWVFLILGANAIVAYVGPILLKTLVLQRMHVGEQTFPAYALATLSESAGKIAGPLIYLALYIGLWVVMCAVLNRYKLYVRV